jgi:hypothetical protein
MDKVTNIMWENLLFLKIREDKDGEKLSQAAACD